MGWILLAIISGAIYLLEGLHLLLLGEYDMGSIYVGVAIVLAVLAKVKTDFVVDTLVRDAIFKGYD